MKSFRAALGAAFDGRHPIGPRHPFAVLALAGMLVAGEAHAQHATDAGFPRLLGMNISAKNYDSPAYQDALARLDVVILSFYPGWKGDRDGSVIRNTVQQLKRRNPALKVGQYTILNEASDDLKRAAADRDKIDKLDREGWWLHNAAGAKQQWTSAYGTWDINISRFAKPDADGLRYPQWLAQRDAKVYFQRVPDFDIWYFDNVMDHSRVSAADWRGNGQNSSGKDAELASAFRQGMADEWDVARRLMPRVVLMGNSDSELSQPEYRGRLQGAFLEALMGKSYSIERNKGWAAMMTHYLDVFANLREPKLVGFNIAGRSDDYRYFRYGFSSCLLGDGYFSFTEDKVGYSSVAWFDEYDQHIGKAVEPPPRAAWRDGVWRRRYETAMVLVNPDAQPRTVPIEPGWRHFKGTQASDVNNGQPVSEVTLQGHDGLLLVKG
jgi:hypothetical protein